MTQDKFDQIWSKIKQNSQDFTFIKEGDKEMLINKEAGFVCMKCKAGDLRR
jgi:hypothetical protein